MVVKLYGMSQAVCPQRVMQCLVEKGVAFDIIHVDLENKEQKEPKYLAKQPFGKVPYIVDGDFELYESRAIVRYYASKYVDRFPNLAGQTLEEKAKVDQWLDVEAMTYNPLVFTIVFNLFVLPKFNGVSGDSAAARAAVEELGRVLDIYERQLGTTQYLAGDEFTLADMSHMPATRYLVEDCGLGHLVRERDHVRAWWEDISARPAWKKVMSMINERHLSFSP